MKQSALFDTGTDSGATFSDCRRWRYRLWRVWNPDLPSVAFVGLNPSKATEFDNDQTVNKCIGFAERWGYGSYFMLNLFAWMATLPNDMKLSPDPVGELNDQHIAEVVSRVDMVCVAWGAHKGIDSRAAEVLAMIKEPYCLLHTDGGYPWHPLYVPYTTMPIRYEVPK